VWPILYTNLTEQSKAKRTMLFSSKAARASKLARVGEPIQLACMSKEILPSLGDLAGQSKLFWLLPNTQRWARQYSTWQDIQMAPELLS
jgi:hypothetical protein